MCMVGSSLSNKWNKQIHLKRLYLKKLTNMTVKAYGSYGRFSRVNPTIQHCATCYTIHEVSEVMVQYYSASSEN